MHKQPLLPAKSSNTPKSATTYTNHSSQQQAEVSHDCDRAITSDEDAFRDMERDAKSGQRGRKKVYWNFLGKRNCNLTGIQWTAVPPIRHFHEDTQTQPPSRHSNIHHVSLFKLSKTLIGLTCWGLHRNFWGVEWEHWGLASHLWWWHTHSNTHTHTQ